MQIAVGDRSWPDYNDRITCRAWRRGKGECGALVPLPADGPPPHRCPFGHYLPAFGTGRADGA